MEVSAVWSFLTRAAADTIVDARYASMSVIRIGSAFNSPNVSRRETLIERMRSEILDSINSKLD
jgi:hypothetical protein